LFPRGSKFNLESTILHTEKQVHPLPHFLFLTPSSNKQLTSDTHPQPGDVIKVKPGHMRQTLHPGGYAVYYRKDRPASFLLSSVVPATTGKKAKVTDVQKAMLRLVGPGLVVSKGTVSPLPKSPASSSKPSTRSPEETAATLEALRTALENFHTPLVFAERSTQGTLYNSIRENMVREAVVQNLEDASSRKFEASLLRLVAWREAGGKGKEEEGAKPIKSVGTYEVDLVVVGKDNLQDGGVCKVQVVVRDLEKEA